MRVKQRPAEIARQRGVKLHRRQLAFAGKAQRQRAVCHAQRSGADIQHRVTFAAASPGQHVETAGNLRLFQTLPPVVERKIEKAGERLLAGRPAVVPFNDADLPRVGLPRQHQQRLAVAGGVECQLALLLLPVERQSQRFAGVLQLALQLTADRQTVGELGQFEPAMQRHGLRQRVMAQRQLLYVELLPLQAGVDSEVVAAIAQRLFSGSEAEIEASGVGLPGRDGKIIELDIGAGQQLLPLRKAFRRARLLALRQLLQAVAVERHLPRGEPPAPVVPARRDLFDACQHALARQVAHLRKPQAAVAPARRSFQHDARIRRQPDAGQPRQPLRHGEQQPQHQQRQRQ